MSSSPRFPTPSDRYEAALRFLGDRIDFERALAIPYHSRELKLERMRELLSCLGSPQGGVPIVHIAGTKGKGSTAAMTSAILTAAGYRTGLFTSPHLKRVEERMAIDGRACDPAELADLVQRVRPVVEVMDRAATVRDPVESGPTYFEITTAMALLHFADFKARAVVLEVGLGGRLDSTNVCQPKVSIITSISFDHMKQLGNTLEAIAAEKAGIIKPGVPVVSGVQEPGPRAVIRQVCRDQGCRLIELGVDFGFEYRPPHDLDAAARMGTFDFHLQAHGERLEYRDVALKLLGEHQGANAAVALAALTELQPSGFAIPEEAIRKGLAGLIWPARVELIARHPAIVIDAAHNLASASALIRALNESFHARRRFLVFATTQEKDIRAMLSALLGQFDHVILTRYLDNPRAVPVEELDKIAGELTEKPYRVCPTPAEAWDAVRREATAADLICVTGSFFIAAQMRHEICQRPVGDDVEC